MGCLPSRFVNGLLASACFIACNGQTSDDLPQHCDRTTSVASETATLTSVTSYDEGQFLTTLLSDTGTTCPQGYPAGSHFVTIEYATMFVGRHTVGDVTTQSDAVAVGFHAVPVDGGTIVGDLTPAASGHVDISAYTPANANDSGRLAGAVDVVFPDNTNMQASFDTPFCRPQICNGM